MGLNTKFDELLDFPCPFPFKVWRSELAEITRWS